MGVDVLRQTFSKSVSYKVAFDRRFRAATRAASNDSDVLVPMLESDTIELAARLVVRSGGVGTLVVLADDEIEAGADTVRVSVIGFTVANSDAGDAPICVPYHRTTTLGDLLRVLAPGSILDLRSDRRGVTFGELTETEIPSSEMAF